MLDEVTLDHWDQLRHPLDKKIHPPGPLNNLSELQLVRIGFKLNSCIIKSDF